MAEASRDQMMASVKGFYTSGKYSDLVITCGSDTYNVHKVVVCSRADFFARAVRFTAGKEAQDGKVDLPEDEPEVVKLLIQYLYEAEYDPVLPTEASGNGTSKVVLIVNRTGSAHHYGFPHQCRASGCNDIHAQTQRSVCPHHSCGNHCNYNCQVFVCDKCACYDKVNGAAEQLLTHSKMYEIADKYDVVGLKELSLEKFNHACKAFWNDASFPVAAHHAFSTTMEDDKGLRDVVSNTIANHMELMEKPEINTLMAEFNGLALGILREKAVEHGWVKVK